MVAYLGEEGRHDAPPLLYAELDKWWGVLSADYRCGGLEESEVREQYIFE